MPRELSDDERMLLKTLATAEEPIDLYGVMQRLLPPRPDGPEWYGQHWWGRQWCATAKNWIDLRTAGMFEHAPVGRGYVLTEAGREALLASAQHDEQQAQDALVLARIEAADYLASLKADDDG